MKTRVVLPQSRRKQRSVSSATARQADLTPPAVTDAGALAVPDAQLSQMAVLHYEQGLSQQEIADRYGISKMTASRMMQRIRETGIVRFEIRFPFQVNAKAEADLCRRYTLRRAVVVKHPADRVMDVPSLLGSAYAFLLELELQLNQVIGLGVGATMGQMVRHLIPMKTENLHLVQLIGGLTNVQESNPFTILQEASRKLQTGGTYVSTLAAVESRAVRDSLLGSTAGRKIQAMWCECDKAIYGIGTMDSGTLLSPDLTRAEELASLRKAGAVGDILGHCFDADGQFIRNRLEERLVSIPVDVLREVGERTAVAGGAQKATAIRIALRTGLIDVLVTDDQAAELLLS
ncbi:MAG TPA: sugar-binding domain-containing protein [Tepidisphaeraceae bacterium]|nr:sugar-binding domain-containing protein [Tepidisphaeraceae bacterium]